MENSEVIEVIYRELYEVSIGLDMKFAIIIRKFADRNWRYDPDLETDLIDEVGSLARKCSIKWHGGGYYIFDGKIYSRINTKALEEAFMLWVSRIGLKVSQRRRLFIFRTVFLQKIELYNILTPRLDLVAFTNGVLDLAEDMFKPFSPDLHCLYMHPYRYNEKAKCPMWNKFLHEVLPDKIQRRILQMFLGLGLIERGTAYNRNEGKEYGKVELCLILVGGGANGKSVIADTARGIFGNNRISSVDYDELTMGGDEGMRARLPMKDCIFNWSTDSDSRNFGKFRTGTFKRIVSGEPVSVREIGKNVSQNDNLPYLVFNLNELPYPEDSSLGFIRRLQFISFDVTIPGAKQDKALTMKLKSEYSGIFNWIMRGSREVRRKHFKFPYSEGNKRAMLLAQLQGNPTVAWVNAYGARSEAAVEGEQYSMIQTKDIYDSIARFCEDNDAPVIPSVQKVGCVLGKLNFVKKRRSKGYEYAMFGVNEKDLLRPYVIRNKDYIDDKDIDDAEEGYITEED